MIIDVAVKGALISIKSRLRDLHYSHCPRRSLTVASIYQLQQRFGVKMGPS